MRMGLLLQIPWARFHTRGLELKQTDQQPPQAAQENFADFGPTIQTEIAVQELARSDTRLRRNRGR